MLGPCKSAIKPANVNGFDMTKMCFFDLNFKSPPQPLGLGLLL
jgi:hypothetical protein